MSTRDGGPAFPRTWTENTWAGPEERYTEGMTLRDWFAGQALAALVAEALDPTTESSGWPPDIAGDAYQIADAMLEARDGTP